MTTTSTNLGLTLWDSTTDQTVTFLNWRLGLTGPSLSSNINKIDTRHGAQFPYQHPIFPQTIMRQVLRLLRHTRQD
jgi:hypothetical protein